MKELSIEEKAKRYNQTIDKIKYVMEHGVSPTLNKEDLQDIFPELKESEDEKIRKEVLAWLKSRVEPKFEVGDWIVRNGEVLQISAIDELINRIFHYWFTRGTWLSSLKIDEEAHLWTIQDAKDGDVLTTDIWTFIFKKCQDRSVYYHCAISTFNNFSISDTGEFDSNYVHPATKEQRDLLFQKMKEASYEWDAEKKELKKIEQKPILDVVIPFGTKDSELEEVTYDIPKGYHAEIEDNKVVIKKDEKKSSWSEEDENLLKLSLENLTELKDRFGEEYGKVGDCIVWLQSLKDRVQPQPKQEWSEEDEQTFIKSVEALEDFGKFELADWLKEHKLKFLKPQSHWEPSDEQMKALDDIIQNPNLTITQTLYNELINLVDSLRKLKD